MRRRRRKAISWLLCVVLFALGWMIYREASGLFSSRDVQAESAATLDPPTTTATSPLLAVPSRESLAVILERPVFSESRRPDGDPDGAGATPDDFRLAGVVISGSERSALILSGASMGLQRLKEGDDLGGWMLVEIALDRIKIRRGGVETELLLDYAAPAPPIPRTESRREKTSVKSVMKESSRQIPKQPETGETGSEGEVQ